MGKEPIIKTDRLILRPLTLDDAEACYSWNSDERVTKYMSYSTYTNISQTIDWIKSTFIDKDVWIWASDIISIMIIGTRDIALKLCVPL